ncbi:MAG: hypothetical protein KF850_32120, partial [Labilithrix sp.]|nr:hypothetical protein [Labilithrix sp.]
MSARLDAIGERLARVLRGPSAIEAQRLFRMARPLLARTGWRASIEASALPELVTLLRADGAMADAAASRTKLDAAIDELERNVLAVERVAIVRKRAPVAHALWLRRVHGLLELAESAIDLAAAGQPDRGRARAAAQSDDSALFPPLVPLRPERTALDVPTTDHPEIDDARLVDLELAAIDHLMAAARAETIVLGRKRRLLVAARQRLLEAAAALPLARDGVR